MKVNSLNILNNHFTAAIDQAPQVNTNLLEKYKKMSDLDTVFLA